MTTIVEIADWERLPASPVVSVAMITYNHERYIAQAIEGVLMQHTDFPIELIIGEDCSTDGTRAIVRDYAERYPERIRLLLPGQNLGANPNFAATMAACRGRYVALCEGDDYWTDPQKLQKQVEFLEAHPECVICHHSALILNTSDQSLTLPPYGPPRDITTLEDLIPFNYIQTCSVMFCNGLIGEFPGWYYKLPFGDWSLHMLNAQHGKIGFIDEAMAVYRVHPGGMWTSRDTVDRHLPAIDFYRYLARYFGTRPSRLIRQQLSNQYLIIAVLCADAGDAASAKPNLHKSIRSYFPLPGMWNHQLALLGMLYFPRLYRLFKRMPVEEPVVSEVAG